jgi:hypothetical protein
VYLFVARSCSTRLLFIVSQYKNHKMIIQADGNASHQLPPLP